MSSTLRPSPTRSTAPASCDALLDLKLEKISRACYTQQVGEIVLRQGKRKRQRIFIKIFRTSGFITKACLTTGISRSTYYRWMEDETFKAEFDDAELQLTELLEYSAVRDALRGDTVTRIFLLKARKPEKYGDRLRHEGTIGFTIAGFAAKWNEKKQDPYQLPAIPSPSPGGSGVVSPEHPGGEPLAEASRDSKELTS